MFGYARHREEGRLTGAERATFIGKDCRQLSLSIRKLINKAHDGAVVCLSLDSVESRYLLAGAADSSIALYDMQAGALQGPAEVNAVAQARRGQEAGHRGMVTSICWYPVDTGMFVTGAFDNEVKVWDTNVFRPACRFALPAKVFAVAMSAVAATHCLVAAAGEDAAVKLCDPASGAFSHTLLGHRSGIWALCWSLHSEYQLLSGDRQGQVRVWDIRRSGTAALLDQDRTTPTPPPSAYPPVRPRGGLPHGPTALPSPPNPTALAHNGAITAILACPDGLHCITAATDDRVRLWDARRHHNRLVHYPGAYNRAMRGRQLACTEDSRTLFCPSGSIILVYDVLGGEQVGQLKEGHYDSINCCAWNPRMRELYSGGNDWQVLVWDMPDAPCIGGADDKDNWSD